MVPIVIGVGVVIAGLLGFAATKPDSFRLQRSTSIKASPAAIFSFIDDFHRWMTWSPWEQLDPDLKRTFSGSPSGKGAAYEWSGNGKVGSGRMEILESVPASKATIQLDFLKPFEAHNFVEFTLLPEGESTRVTWSMYGPSPFMSKVMQVFVSMDSMVGKDFEKGLANLKSAAEA